MTRHMKRRRPSKARVADQEVRRRMNDWWVRGRMAQGVTARGVWRLGGFGARRRPCQKGCRLLLKMQFAGGALDGSIMKELGRDE